MNAQEVAWLLAEAATRPDFFETLCRNPNAAAKALGLPAMTKREAAEILEYAKGMQMRAQEGGTQVLIYPLPELSGPPGKARKAPKR